MATQENVQTITLDAAADISALQFKFVDVNSAGAPVIPTGAGATAIGVLLNKPDGAGKAATVAISGVVKVVIGTGDLVAGNIVQSDAAGEAILGTTGDNIVGRALTGGVAGELASVLLIHNGIL